MIAPRLVELIERHSEDLAQGLLQRLAADHRTADFVAKVPQEEIRQRAFEVYHNLSDWLIDRTEADVERAFTRIGAQRATQDVALSSLVAAIAAVKERLWAFLKTEAMPERPQELLGEIELLEMVDLFFDRATYYAALGYEREKRSRGDRGPESP